MRVTFPSTKVYVNICETISETNICANLYVKIFGNVSVNVSEKLYVNADVKRA